MKSELLQYHGSCPLGAEQLLADELRGLGAVDIRAAAAGVGFRGSLETGYLACLWSRVAGRILLQLGQCRAVDGDSLYQGAREIAWQQHLGANTTLAVSASSRAAAISHSHFAALKLKDAVVDQLRAETGDRPSIDTRQPDVRLHLHLDRNRASISLDMAGHGLHQRGYRGDGSVAPLKENLAATLLLLCGWPALAKRGAAFFDPMCGSATLAIEAAMIATDMAPGLLRPRFGFERWRGHDPALWQRITDQAATRRAAGGVNLGPIVGLDRDAAAVSAARANLESAGLGAVVQIRRADLESINAPVATAGLLLTNPPYGHRLSAEGGLPRLYGMLGHKLKQYFGGWRVGVFSGEPDLLRRLRLGEGRQTALYNGPIACQLGCYQVVGRDRPQAPAAGSVNHTEDARADAGATPVDTTMFVNRLRKNRRHWGRWARRKAIECYRVYDQDLPEYALAIDVYPADRLHLLVQEYQAPAKVDPGLAEQRLQAALLAVAEVFEVTAEQVHLKTRERQRGQNQYAKIDRQGRFLGIRESGHEFLVNLTDYLDSGLFLDHRLTRQRLQAEAAGKRFLNLYCYTGSATVYAAAGGALATTSIDLSATYLDWCRRNLALNGFDGERHELVQADCGDWLRQAARRQAYDLVFVDPPTFSNSKRMQGTLDVQRDHGALLDLVRAVLKPDGTVYFSTNARRFKLDPGLQDDWRIEDLSRDTLPEDFARRPRIHQCWRLRPRDS